MFAPHPYLYTGDPLFRLEGMEPTICFCDWKFRLAKLLQPRSIVEFGVRYGYSAASFLAASPGAMYHGYDNDGGEYGGTKGAYLVAGEMLAKKFPESRTRVVKLDTQTEMPSGRGYDLAHIDGDHSFEGCLSDLRLATELGSQWILVDDICHAPVPGVARAVKQFLSETGLPHLYFDNSYRGDCLIMALGQRIG